VMVLASVVHLRRREPKVLPVNIVLFLLQLLWPWAASPYLSELGVRIPASAATTMNGAASVHLRGCTMVHDSVTASAGLGERQVGVWPKNTLGTLSGGSSYAEECSRRAGSPAPWR
jgi:hypothetical protein